MTVQELIDRLSQIPVEDRFMSVVFVAEEGYVTPTGLSPCRVYNHEMTDEEDVFCLEHETFTVPD